MDNFFKPFVEVFHRLSILKDKVIVPTKNFLVSGFFMGSLPKAGKN